VASTEAYGEISRIVWLDRSYSGLGILRIFPTPPRYLAQRLSMSAWIGGVQQRYVQPIEEDRRVLYGDNRPHERQAMPYSENFEKAFCWAADLHRTQCRKGTSIPYITHLMAVAAIVGENRGTEDEVIAALLHDAIEDTDATYNMLVDRFDKPVADIVKACSDADVKPKPEWEKRKKDYIAHIVGASESVRLVSAADKLANARSVLADLRVLSDALWGRFNGGKVGTLWYYRSLVSVFRIAGSSPIVGKHDRTKVVVEELDRVVTEIERLASVA
jgi:hypothetical protein